MSENIHEELARYKKSTALTDTLQAAKIDSDTVASFTEGQWFMASQAAQVKMPSKATQECVMTLLRAREASIERYNDRDQSDLVPHMELPDDGNEVW